MWSALWAANATLAVLLLVSLPTALGWHYQHAEELIRSTSISKTTMLHATATNGGKHIVANTPTSVGIDLGTTYSLVSVVEKGKPKLLKIDGSVLFPSVVGFQQDGNILVGKDALEYAVKSPKNVFFSVKRLIGRTLKEARARGDIRQFGKRIQQVVHHETGKEVVGLVCPAITETMLPEELSAYILKKLIARASEYYEGRPITNAVITVPAYFTKDQRETTERAGKLAGLQKIKILKEPEAAALAYGFNVESPQLVMVFDLGGGTFDVSVLEVGDGLVEVIATGGDNHLGGDDFDQVIVDFILKQIEAVSKEALREAQADSNYMKSLRDLAIQVKCELTTKQNTTISVKLNTKPDMLEIKLTRRKFEELSKELLIRLLTPIRQTAIVAGINLPGESADIGTYDLEDEDDDQLDDDDYEEDDESDESKIKALKLAQMAGKKLSKQKSKVKGDAGKELRRLRKESGYQSMKLFPSGRNLDDVILVGGATRMPCVAKAVKMMTGIDPKRHINPDEAVCLGAGVMAGVLDGTIEQFQVLSSWQSTLLKFMHEQQQAGNFKFESAPATDVNNNPQNLGINNSVKIETKTEKSSSQKDSSAIPPSKTRVSFKDRILSKRKSINEN